MSKTKPPQQLPGSAQRVQNADAQRRAQRIDTENRLLRRHQQEIRDWLAESIDTYTAARHTDQALDVADAIHTKAVDWLTTAQARLEQ